ncbi:AbiTii domain-containing protein [Mesorhizobium sp. 43Arga]
MATETITPSRKALSEALALAEDILRNIELSEVSLAVTMLKASRLARLLNDVDYRLAFEYEASGYPSTPDGITPDVWKVAQLSGRVQSVKETVANSKVEHIVERANTQAIEAIEQRITVNNSSLDAARDPNVSISSANPHQFIGNPIGNTAERNSLRKAVSDDAAFLAGRRGFVHRYVSRRYDELRFSGIAGDIFSRIRTAVDERVGITIPKAVQKFSAVYENLESDNPEDWANAVHSCRRILQDLADALFPSRDDKVKTVNGKERTIKLGPDNYINRLIALVEDNSASVRFEAIVGSNLHYLGDRLDAAFTAAQKGSHSEISSREEADRYVVYTYMLVADLLSLSAQDVSAPSPSPQTEPIQLQR